MKIVAANWKLNKNPQQTREFLQEFKKSYKAKNAAEKIVFFPPATNLESAAQVLTGSGIEFGAQNCHRDYKGAFTGEISAQVVKDLGAQWVLVGHSERRKIFLEKDELIARKVSAVQEIGLHPMLCIGETLEERQEGKTNLMLNAQLQIGLQGADRKKFVVVAYEPVWAIGTGVVATAEQVQEAHEYIYKLITQMGFSVETPILYGGSVKGDNAKQLSQIPHVDGFLVGGASLEVPSFLEIVNAI